MVHIHKIVIIFSGRVLLRLCAKSGISGINLNKSVNFKNTQRTQDILVTGTFSEKSNIFCTMLEIENIKRIRKLWSKYDFLS